MLSRALSSATVMLLIGCFPAARGQAENLEAGKSPSQIFAGTCTACHKGPRGLLRTVSPGSLPSFLREHYTTSPDMAKLLSGFLISNGATDTHNAGAQPKQPRDAKLDARPGVEPRQAPEPRQAARPDTDGLSQQGEPGHLGRNAKRLARPGEAPEGAKPAANGQAPVQATIEPGPQPSAKQKLTKRGKPGSEESPKTDMDRPDVAKGEPSNGESARDLSKTEPIKEDGSQPEAAKPATEGKSETPKSETPKSETPKSDAPKVDASRETGGGAIPPLRPDPVPPVTPALPASAAAPAVVSSGTPEPAAAAPPMPAQSPSPPAAPPAVTASVPPAPATPSGPPAPPISQ